MAYKKLTVFKSPLYMAFSYEEKQRPLHSILADVLRDTSVFVNATINMLSSEVRNFHENFQSTSSWFVKV